MIFMTRVKPLLTALNGVAVSTVLDRELSSQFRFSLQATPQFLPEISGFMSAHQ